MRVETNGHDLDVVTSTGELLEAAGLALLLAIPFLLAGLVLGLTMVAGIIFAAVVIHCAIRYS